MTSDHGEEFLDHGNTIHGKTLFEEQLRVPLVIHQPAALAPRRVASAVRLIDLAPTLLELAGLPAGEADLQGRSFASLLSHGKQEPRTVFGEATWSGEHRSIRTGDGTKLIHRPADGHTLLYDLVEDPLERDDRSRRDAATVERLREELARWAAANQERRAGTGESADVGAVALDEGMRSRLPALGYLD